MRTFRDLLCLFFGLVLIALVTATANAQGVIVPGPCRRCPPLPRPIPVPRALPVKSIKIDTKIAAQVATTHVEQVFRNDTDATLEGTYFFPIPETASIVEFAIWEAPHLRRDRPPPARPRPPGVRRPRPLPGQHLPHPAPLRQEA